MKQLIFLLLLIALKIDAQWVKTSELPDGNIRCFAVNDTTLFVSTYENGIFRTTDKGDRWSTANNGLPDIVYSIAVSPVGNGDANLFAGTFLEGVFLSTDNGSNWIPVNNGLTGVGVHTLIVSSNEDGNTNVFAGISGGGVFRSTNDGLSWSAFNSGFTPPEVIYDVNKLIVSPNISGKTIFAGTGFGVFISTIDSAAWTCVNTDLTNLNVRTLAVSYDNNADTSIFAGTFTHGIFHSGDNGRTWTPANTGLTSTVVYCFEVLYSDKGDINIFAGISGGVFLSTNYGLTWNEVNLGLTTQFEPNVFDLAICGTDLFAGTDDGVWRRPLSEMITDIDNEENKIPSQFILEQNYPNPFNPTTTISFGLPSQSFVSLKIFNLLGKEVATIISEELPAGNYKREWKAESLVSGIYFCRLQAGKFNETKKLILLR